MICINVATPRQRYKLRAQKKSDFVQKAGHFHDLAGRGTSGKKAGLSRQKWDGWQVCPSYVKPRADNNAQPPNNAPGPGILSLEEVRYIYIYIIIFLDIT